MWKFYTGAIVLLIAVLAASAAIQLKATKQVTRPALYQPSTGPSQDDRALSNMRIPQ